MKKQTLIATLSAGLILASTPALAHYGIGHENGLSHGIEHFFSGTDHILYAIGAGAISAIFAGKRTLTIGFAALSLAIFAIIHKIGLLDGQGVSGFEAGQMITAGMVLFASYVISRPLIGKLKLGRFGNER